jgi:hypothetical protein
LTVGEQQMDEKKETGKEEKSRQKTEWHQRRHFGGKIAA